MLETERNCEPKKKHHKCNSILVKMLPSKFVAFMRAMIILHLP